MHQTRKGKQWYFGMKAHVGVDSQTKLIHSVVATAANAADCTMLPHLLHGEETRVWGDQAYRGQSEVLREHAPHAQDFTHQRYRYKDRIDEVERAKNRTKSTVRSKVEHVFAVMKLKFGFVKVRYRGLDKNANRLFVTCALVNLFLVRKRLLDKDVAKWLRENAPEPRHGQNYLCFPHQARNTGLSSSLSMYGCWIGATPNLPDDDRASPENGGS